MSAGFRRHRRSGRSVATFTVFEADLLRSLARQLIELLRHEAAAPEVGDPLEQLLDFTGPTTAPEDPVLARLFPSAYADDEEAAGDFRRFTEGSLRDGKAAGAAAVIDTLEEAGLTAEPQDGVFIDVELAGDAVWAWLRTITDMRLAIAARLGIDGGGTSAGGIEADDEPVWADLSDDDPRAQVHDIYDWLGFLQETLVRSAG